MSSLRDAPGNVLENTDVSATGKKLQEVASANRKE